MYPISGKRLTTLRLLVSLGLVLAFAVELICASVEDYRKQRQELDRQLAEERYALGLWCKEQNLFEEAREEFERVLTLDPTHAGATQQMAELASVVRKVRSLPCEIHMVNGDLMKADLMMTNFKVATPAGILLIPVSETDQIDVGPGLDPDHIIADSFTGEGRIRTETFAAKSKVGPISVKRQDVKSIRILRPCEVCAGQAQIKCRRCNGTGRLTEKSTCPDCNGKGSIKCSNCNGAGQVTCPLCGGQGTFIGPGGWGWRRRSLRCPRCDGTGKVDCDRCENGAIVCPTCKGKPTSSKAGPCPVCNGKKAVDCEGCVGTGVKPLQKVEPEEPPTPNVEIPKPEEPPAPPEETQP